MDLDETALLVINLPLLVMLLHRSLSAHKVLSVVNLLAPEFYI
jgi:hypothetical protein